MIDSLNEVIEQNISFLFLITIIIIICQTNAFNYYYDDYEDYYGIRDNPNNDYPYNDNRYDNYQYNDEPNFRSTYGKRHLIRSFWSKCGDIGTKCNEKNEKTICFIWEGEKSGYCDIREGVPEVLSRHRKRSQNLIDSDSDEETIPIKKNQFNKKSSKIKSNKKSGKKSNQIEQQKEVIENHSSVDFPNISQEKNK